MQQSHRPMAVVAILVTAMCARPTAGQRAALERSIAQSIADLGDPAKATDAARALEHLGSAAVPALRELLREPRRYDEPEARICSALYVLGRIGAPAATALPELRDILAIDAGKVLRQALWTLGQLSFHLADLDREQLQLGVLNAVRSRAEDDDGFTRAVVAALLHLGRAPATDRLIAAIRDRYDNEVVAACLHVGACPPSDPTARRDLISAVEDRLGPALERPALPWRNTARGTAITGYLAAAWQALTNETGDGRIARGLLRHWDPWHRLRGALWLKEHGADLPLRERGDLVACAWDSDPAIAHAAIDAFVAWERSGLLALPSLRRLQQQHHDATVREHCAAAAGRIVASFVSADERALLGSIDAILLGNDAAGPAAGSNDVMALWAEVLFGAQWCDGRAASSLLALCDQTGVVDGPAIAAVMPWIANSNAEVTSAALRWLARRGRAVAAAVDNGEFELRYAVRFFAPDAAKGTGLEAMAWVVAAPHGVVDTLSDLVDGARDFDMGRYRPTAGWAPADQRSTDTRLLGRALSSLIVDHPDALAAQRAQLRLLVAIPDATKVEHWLPGWMSPQQLDADLAPQVRLLAAVALAAGGDVAFDQALVALSVRAHCGVTVADLPKWLAEQRAAGRLAAWLDGIEAECRATMDVNGSGWPTLAKAPAK